MSVYECNENQFVENVRRLLDSGKGFVVNRRVSLRDDHRYGLSTLPDQEFAGYGMICGRQGYKYTTYTKIPFLDDFHRRLYPAGEALHSASNLNLPRLSIPYYKVEYSFNLWGGTYIYTFDVLFEPEIVMEKRGLSSRMRRNLRTRGASTLVHVLKFNPPDEKMFTLNLPKRVVILDVKKMTRIVDI